MRRTFFSELKRRQIYRGGVMYVVAGWVMVQVATQVFPFFSIPDWAIRFLVVAVLLGFPVALVCLWMFESTLPDEESKLVDRRQGRDAAAEMARLLEAERSERHRETQELIATLAQMREGQPPGAAQGPATYPEPGHRTDTATHDRNIAAAAANDALHGDESRAAPGDGTHAPPIAHAARRRRGPGGALLALLAVAILVSGAWALLAPESTFQPIDAPEALTKQYVIPGFAHLERLGVGLLRPLLHKLGIPLAPEHVFTALMVVLAFLVLRGMWRALLRGRREARMQRAV